MWKIGFCHEDNSIEEDATPLGGHLSTKHTYLLEQEGSAPKTTGELITQC